MATPAERALWFPERFRTIHRDQWDVYFDGRLRCSWPTQRAADDYVAVFGLGYRTEVVKRHMTYQGGSADAARPRSSGP